MLTIVNVVTTPAGEILRNRLVPESMTITFPDASAVRLVGASNVADVPTALLELPATPVPA
jgi:hypothetical protein